MKRKRIYLEVIQDPKSGYYLLAEHGTGRIVYGQHGLTLESPYDHGVTDFARATATFYVDPRLNKNGLRVERLNVWYRRIPRDIWAKLYWWFSVVRAKFSSTHHIYSITLDWPKPEYPVTIDQEVDL